MKKIIIIRAYLTSFICLIYLINVSSQVIKNGLVANYKFNGSLTDLSQHKNNCRVEGNERFGTDRFGSACGAFNFDGATYLKVKESPSLKTIKNKLSVSLWFKTNVGPDAYKFVSIICKGGEKEEVIESPAYRVEFTPKTISVSTVFTSSILQVFRDNQWYHLAVTFNGNIIKLYFNGNKINEIDFGQEYYGLYYNQNDDTPLFIGRDIPGRDDIFKGYFDDLYIFNRELTENEVKLLYSDVSEKNASMPCIKKRPVLPPITKIKVKEEIIIPPRSMVGNVTITDTAFITSDSIGIKIFDHDKIDNDSITLFVDSQPILENILLESENKSKSIIYLKLKIGKSYVLTSKALNEGKIPINTAAIEIFDNKGKKQLFKLRSKKGHSSALLIKYK